MGVWFELVLACNLKDEAPQQVVDILKYIVNPPYNEETLEPEPISIPEHNFFTKHEWWYTLLGMATSYFPGDTYASLMINGHIKRYKFTIRAMHRDEELIDSFVHWLAPYSHTQGFVGYTRCDETPDSIDLIYFENNTVHYRSVGFYATPPRITQIKITEDGRDRLNDG